MEEGLGVLRKTLAYPRGEGQSFYTTVPPGKHRGDAAPCFCSGHSFWQECLLFLAHQENSYLPFLTQLRFFSSRPFLISQRQVDKLPSTATITNYKYFVTTSFLALIFLKIGDGQDPSLSHPCSPRAKGGASHMVPAQPMLTLNGKDKMNSLNKSNI